MTNHSNAWQLLLPTSMVNWVDFMYVCCMTPWPLVDHWDLWQPFLPLDTSLHWLVPLILLNFTGSHFVSHLDTAWLCSHPTRGSSTSNSNIHYVELILTLFQSHSLTLEFVTYTWYRHSPLYNNIRSGTTSCLVLSLTIHAPFTVCVHILSVLKVPVKMHFSHLV